MFCYSLLKTCTHLKVEAFIIAAKCFSKMVKSCSKSQHILFITVLYEKSKVRRQRRQGFFFFFFLISENLTLYKDFNLIF